MATIEDVAVIGRSLKIKGVVCGEKNLHVQGEIDGVVQLAGARLTVAAEGHLRAAVQAQEVVVFGHIEGEMRVAGRIDLRAGAVVQGDIFAAHLSIEEGAVLRGKYDASRANEPIPDTARAAPAPPQSLS